MMEYKIDILLCGSRTAHVHGFALCIYIYMDMDFFNYFFSLPVATCSLKAATNVRIAWVERSMSKQFLAISY